MRKLASDNPNQEQISYLRGILDFLLSGYNRDAIVLYEKTKSRLRELNAPTSILALESRHNTADPIPAAIDLLSNGGNWERLDLLAEKLNTMGVMSKGTRNGPPIPGVGRRRSWTNQERIAKSIFQGIRSGKLSGYTMGRSGTKNTYVGNVDFEIPTDAIRIETASPQKRSEAAMRIWESRRKRQRNETEIVNS